MTNVYLYGELRNKFGDEFKFNINSPKEALLAINANKKGFLDEVKKLAMKGIQEVEIHSAFLYCYLKKYGNRARPACGVSHTHSFQNASDPPHSFQ